MKNFYFLLFLLLAACNDDDISQMPPPVVEPIDQLPPITMNGANTFGCLINGEVWVADNPGILVGGGDFEVDVRYDEPDSFLRIKAKRDKSNQDDVFAFFANNVNGFGEYLIPYKESLFTAFDGCGFYELDTLSERTLKINHLDFEDETISGEFNFTVIGIGNCIDTLVITAGRFDAEYR